MTENSSNEDIRKVEELAAAIQTIREQLGKVIVGQDRVIEEVLITIFSRGHALLVGVPGLAKTLMLSTLAKALHLKFHRIQFTPDLMPSDITGTEVIQENKSTGARELRFIKGPIFANIILADEINRTPPKTQAALLESMQERQVSLGGQVYPLEQPFFVLATQNPIEQEGTYPLPEAQLDRFMFEIRVDYPAEEEEFEIVKNMSAIQDAEIRPVLDAGQIVRLQDIVRRVPVSDSLIRYAMRLARSTRVRTPGVPDFINEWITWGAGPRASQYLVLAARARAIIHGRHYVAGQDIEAVALPVLRHRIVTNFNADADGITTDHVIGKLLETVEKVESEAAESGRLV